MEACNVETKKFRCRRDGQSGTQVHAEEFEHVGESSSPDALERGTTGSGVSARTFVPSRHAGTAAGGSLLRNSSFSSVTTASGRTFTGWDDTSGVTPVQDTANFYRSFPGASVDASLSASGSFRIDQPLRDMRTSRFDGARPYFLRVMVNPTIGVASGGDAELHLGSQTATLSVASMAVGWNELVIPFDANTWFKNWNTNDFTVGIEWSGATSGTLLFDDMVFTPWDLIDGTYWIVVGGPTPWLRDDTLEFTDTGGAPADAILQWWLFISGLGYLPSSGTPTITDPV